MVGNAAYGFTAGEQAYPRSRAMSFALTRFVLIAVLLFSALVSVAGALLLLYGWTNNETVYQGVTVAGADLRGLTEQQATDRIASQIRAVAPAQVVLTYNGQNWTLPASSLGVSYDAQATAADAFRVGHQGNLWEKSRDWLSSVISGEQVPVAFHIDNQALYLTLQKLSTSIVQSPQNAGYVFSSDKALSIQESKPGVAVDVAATMDALQNSVGNLSSSPIEIRTKSIPATVDAKTLEPGLKLANQMVSTPFVLIDHGTKWEIAPETLREMLTAGSSGDGNTVQISEAALESYVAQIANQVKTQGQNAGVRWENGQFAVVKSTSGETLDARATAANVIQALGAGKHQVAVAVTSTPAQVVESDAQDAIARAGQIINQPFTLTWAGGSQDLTAAQLAPILSFTAQPGQNPKIAIGLQPDAISSLLSSLRSKTDTPAKDADLRYLNGKVTVVAPEQAGTTLNIDASTRSIEQAITGGNHSAVLATDPVEPKVTAAMASSVVINQKLSSGQTYYGGSVANRAFNVNLAVQRVNGALIPPGGTFSFDGTVGAVDTAHGYKLGYGIVATTDGSVSTVPSVGGGICQVATTLFHAAFWAGMPIVQRSWHLYWIPLYGQKPSGITGLDATVDTDVGLDLKFKNTTDHWLAVVATADGTWVRFELWGTDPGWKVNVDNPVVTNVVKADTTMQYEKSDQLRAGTSVLVEHAQDGFDVTVHRQVLKDGNVIDDLTMKSHYLPAANVTLQGTGT